MIKLIFALFTCRFCPILLWCVIFLLYLMSNWVVQWMCSIVCEWKTYKLQITYALWEHHLLNPFSLFCIMIYTLLICLFWIMVKDIYPFHQVSKARVRRTKEYYKHSGRVAGIWIFFAWPTVYVVGMILLHR